MGKPPGRNLSPKVQEERDKLILELFDRGLKPRQIAPQVHLRESRVRTILWKADKYKNREKMISSKHSTENV